MYDRNRNDSSRLKYENGQVENARMVILYELVKFAVALIWLWQNVIKI